MLIKFALMYDNQSDIFTPHHTEAATFVGTSALERGYNEGDLYLDNLLNIDLDKWEIVGIHAKPATGYQISSGATILAVNKEQAVQEVQDIEVVDVVNFSTDLTFDEVMECMKRASFFFTPKGYVGTRFNVVAEETLDRIKI